MTIVLISIKYVATIFSDSTQVIQSTVHYFQIVGFSYIFYGLSFIISSALNGMKLTKKSMKISLVKSFALTVPLTLIGSFWGIVGIFTGLAISNVLAGLYALLEIKKNTLSLKSI